MSELDLCLPYLWTFSSPLRFTGYRQSASTNSRLSPNASPCRHLRSSIPVRVGHIFSHARRLIDYFFLPPSIPAFPPYPFRLLSLRVFISPPMPLQTERTTPPSPNLFGPPLSFLHIFNAAPLVHGPTLQTPPRCARSNSRYVASGSFWQPSPSAVLDSYSYYGDVSIPTCPRAAPIVGLARPPNILGYSRQYICFLGSLPPVSPYFVWSFH